MTDRTAFMPTTAEDMRKRGWSEPDFVYVTGDAYVDHPSFGCAVICRVLESRGFRVAVLAQPDWHDCRDFRRFGRPRLGFLVSSGNIDSMVAHYTVAKRRRTYDYYSPAGLVGKRPDRAVIVYSNRIREAYGDVPIIIGGLEASLRRFAHYDYWDDKIRRSILYDSSADLISYGMGETSVSRIAELLDKNIPVGKIRDVRGTVWCGKPGDKVHFDSVSLPSYADIVSRKELYAESFGVQYRESDSVRGRALVESYGDRIIVANPPSLPLETEQLDAVYALPYTRLWHPDYDARGGVPALAEVKFSVTHNRGCFGGCHFCAITFHQGREVRSRSADSVIDEVKQLAAMPDFKGYISDIGGPTAQLRHPACDRQKEYGTCANRLCMSPRPCPHLKIDHSEYASILRRAEAVPGVKAVFVRSGIRFDYLLYDRDRRFFEQLVGHHVSGQLKVAPEHCAANTLAMMGKPNISVYERFRDEYFRMCDKVKKKQYLVPYLMSSHPGTTMSDAVELAQWLKRGGYAPEQVQDFYPTPGTVSTVMYATGIDPLTKKQVYVCRDPHEKKLQRALMAYKAPKNAPLIREALRLTGREDLIGYTASCLVRPESRTKAEKQTFEASAERRSRGGGAENRSTAKAESRGGGAERKGKSSYAKATPKTAVQEKKKPGNTLKGTAKGKAKIKKHL